MTQLEGGLAQSLYAGSLGGHSQFTDAQKAQYANNAQLIGASAGLFLSEGKAENVTTAAAIARSGFENNYLKHSDLDDLTKALKKCEALNGGECPRNLVQKIQRDLQALSDARDEALLANCMGDEACINAEKRDTITHQDVTDTLEDAGLDGYNIEFGANAYVGGAVWEKANRDARALSGNASHCSADDTACLRAAQRDGFANLVTLGAYDSAVALAGCGANVSLSACSQTLTEAGVVVVTAGAGAVVIKVGNTFLRIARSSGGFETQDLRDFVRGDSGSVKPPWNAANRGRAAWTQVSSDARAIARDIENATGVPIPSNQRSQLANQLRDVDHRNPVSDADYANLQREYRRNRTQMIKDWEVNTGQSWPEGAQLHHVIPQRYGGPNQWWNAHPALPSQHQGGIHGTGSPTQGVFPTPVPRQ